MSSVEVHGRHLIDLQHVKQLYSWDCGLACLAMIFKFVCLIFWHFLCIIVTTTIIIIIPSSSLSYAF